MSERKVALVTGASGTIGEAIARGMAEQDHALVMVGRNLTRIKEAAQRVRESTSGAQVDYQVCDQSSQREVQALSERLAGPLHVLINNAADTPRRRELTPEGIERQFATNVLGYFWLMETLAPRLAETARHCGEPSRIVNVASYWAGGLDLDDLEFERRPYDNDTAYRQSKQADRMLSAALAPRLASQNISVNACHPGDVNSQLSNSLGFGGHQGPEDGARTPVWLASSRELEGLSGQYFEHQQQKRCPFSADTKAVARLASICADY